MSDQCLTTGFRPQIEVLFAWNYGENPFLAHYSLLPLFRNCVNAKTVAVSFQAVWALGNIAGDSSVCRDYVLNCAILPPLLM